jgi:hypothetical protein
MQAQPRATTWDHSFRAGAVGVIAIAVIAIGGAYYWHQKRVREQKVLYAEYVKENAWRPPVKAAYAKFAGRMEQLDQINPAHEKDSSRMDALMAQIRLDAVDLKSVPKPSVYPASAIAPQVDGLVASYADRLRIAKFRWSIVTDGRDYQHATEYAQLPSEKLLKMKQPEFGKMLRRTYRYEGQPRPLLMDELQRRLIANYEMRSPWSGGDDERKTLDKLINQDTIPAGLDLDFARTLK